MAVLEEETRASVESIVEEEMVMLEEDAKKLIESAAEEKMTALEDDCEARFSDDELSKESAVELNANSGSLAEVLFSLEEQADMLTTKIAVMNKVRMAFENIVLFCE